MIQRSVSWLRVTPIPMLATCGLQKSKALLLPQTRLIDSWTASALSRLTDWARLHPYLPMVVAWNVLVRTRWSECCWASAHICKIKFEIMKSSSHFNIDGIWMIKGKMLTVGHNFRSQRLFLLRTLLWTSKPTSAISRKDNCPQKSCA